MIYKYTVKSDQEDTVGYIDAPNAEEAERLVTERLTPALKISKVVTEKTTMKEVEKETGQA